MDKQAKVRVTATYEYDIDMDREEYAGFETIEDAIANDQDWFSFDSSWMEFEDVEIAVERVG